MTARHSRSRSSLLLAVALLGVIASGASATYLAQQWVGGVSPAAVAVRLAEMISADSTGALRLDGLDARLHPGVSEVYAARDGQPVWMNETARTDALALLQTAALDGLLAGYGGGRLDSLAGAPFVTDSSLAAFDLLLTDALLRLGDDLGRPHVDAHALYGNDWFPAAVDRPDIAARLVASLTRPDGLEAWADSLRPPHPGYRHLRTALARELALSERPDLVLTRDIAPGDTGAAVVVARERLALDGITGAGDGRRFDEPLAEALRERQRALGLPPTGRLDAATREHLNQRRPDLIPHLQVNLERWRWLPRDLGALHVWVNIPRFELVVREHEGGTWTEPLRFRTVVGTRGWETPVFSDTIETVVFNPTWSIPASIQREQYGRYIGYMVRPPGPGNALGRAKFIFPNDHAIYIHDTPSKWAFSQEGRARSHGCIRAADPEALAATLLSRTNGWSPEQVAEVYRGPWRLRPVPLEQPVPVHLVYFTLWVDAAGRVRALNDVYEHDGPLAAALGLMLPELPFDPFDAPELIADDA